MTYIDIIFFIWNEENPLQTAELFRNIHIDKIATKSQTR